MSKSATAAISPLSVKSTLPTVLLAFCAYSALQYTCAMWYGSGTSIGSGQPQTHPTASLIPPQLILKEVAALPQPAAKLTSQQYQKIPAGHPLIHVPHTGTETKLAGAQIQKQPQ